MGTQSLLLEWEMFTSMKLELLSFPSGRVAGDSLEQPLKGMVDNFEERMLQDASVWSNMCDGAQMIKP